MDKFKYFIIQGNSVKYMTADREDALLALHRILPKDNEPALFLMEAKYVTRSINEGLQAVVKV